ncbi:MAG: hypothetical protein ACXVLQ_16785 [Bacteriovorax sp.]
MRAVILALILFGEIHAASASGCNETQLDQGCYTDQSDGSNGERSWQCMIKAPSDKSYNCPICEENQIVKIETACKTVWRHCSPMGGCDGYQQTICHTGAVCR